MNQKCPECGLVNWSDAEECKRCKAPLQAQEIGDAPAVSPTSSAFEQRPVFEPMPIVAQRKPARVMGVLMIIWGVLITASGLYLLSYHGPASHVLVLGPATIISGIALVRGSRWEMAPYFVGVIVMFLWLFTDERVVLAIGTTLFASLVGVLIAKRRWPVLAGGLIVMSSVAFVGAMLLLMVLMRPAKVAWRTFQPAQGNFTLQMPGETVALPPIVQNVSGYTMTKHPYESKVWGQGSAGYIVIEYSPALPVRDASQYERFMEVELDNLLKNTNSTLISKLPLPCHGYPGLSFELQPPPSPSGREARKMIGRMFMNANYLYVMQLSASDSSELMANSIKFLDPTPLH